MSYKTNQSYPDQISRTFNAFCQAFKQNKSLLLLNYVSDNNRFNCSLQHISTLSYALCKMSKLNKKPAGWLIHYKDIDKELS